jgi:hypothetical protein
VPDSSDLLQLRRVHSESRFCLPAVSSILGITCQQTIDDESDLLEIDLNNPLGSIHRTLRSQTESELITSHAYSSLNQCMVSSSLPDDMFINKQQAKQLRDQTTNTPPMSRLTSSLKSKKRLKKKNSPVPNNANEQIATPIDNTSTSPMKLQKVDSHRQEYIE